MTKEERKKVLAEIESMLLAAPSTRVRDRAAERLLEAVSNALRRLDAVLGELKCRSASTAAERISVDKGAGVWPSPLTLRDSVRRAPQSPRRHVVFSACGGVPPSLVFAVAD